MKIRTGFVSNSSSTSFTVSTTKYKTVFDLAQAMIACRGYNNDQELIEKIEEQKNLVDPDSNICFPTCNFDTYICRIEDYYVISTCNNHDFQNYIDISDNYPESFKEKAEIAGYGGNERFYCEFNLEKDFSFWYPNLEVFGEEISYHERYKNKNICNKHCEYDLFTVNGTIMCKGCLLEGKNSI